MEDIIKNLDNDISRCEKVLTENSYLEIVIAIEEILDKYKKNIFNKKDNEKNNVWNYTKKDLENIHMNLLLCREEIINKEKQIVLSDKIEEIKELSKEKSIIEILNLIIDVNNKYTNNKNIDNKENKWNEIKNTLELIKNKDMEIGLKLLEIIMITMS